MNIAQEIVYSMNVLSTILKNILFIYNKILIKSLFDKKNNKFSHNMKKIYAFSK